MLKAITQWIVNNTAAWAIPLVKGTTLQVGWRPTTAPDRCHLIAESGGGSTVFDLADRVDKMIQILTRAPKYFDAEADAMLLFALMNGTAGWQLPIVVAGNKYWGTAVQAVSAPQYLGIDAKGRHEFSTNYEWKIGDRD